MRNIIDRIISRLAEEQIAKAWLEGYNLGLAKGKESTRRHIVNKLENFGIEEFNDTALILGFQTALSKAREE